jgi:uncharacterized OB-fold protein
VTGRPVAVPDEVSAPFWEAAAAGRLVLARCGVCGELVHPPVCGHELVWEAVEGGGAVRSWTVVRQPFLPGFDALVPFVLVDVELDAQPELRLIGRLLDGADAPLAIGDRVEVAFDAGVPAFTLERAT